MALVRTYVSEKLNASIIAVTTIGELRTTLAVTSKRLCISSQRASVDTANVPNSLIIVTVMMEAPSSSETSLLTRATRRHITEDGILLNIHPFSGQDSVQQREHGDDRQ
jgi:hypothetical protein